MLELRLAGKCSSLGAPPCSSKQECVVTSLMVAWFSRHPRLQHGIAGSTTNHCARTCAGSSPKCFLRASTQHDKTPRLCPRRCAQGTRPRGCKEVHSKHRNQQVWSPKLRQSGQTGHLHPMRLSHVGLAALFRIRVFIPALRGFSTLLGL